MNPTRPLSVVALLATAALAVPPGFGGDAPAAKVDVVKIKTPRGAVIEATLHTPAKPNAAAVVLAPGQGYHRALPILAKSAEALAAAGFRALRFDWAYTPSKGQPSDDLSKEREDLEAAIDYVKALAGVTKIVVAGKSLGSSVVFARALERSDDLAGIALLTFPMHQPGGQPNPGVERLGEPAIPTLIVQGDQDPLGSLPALYDLASKAKHAPRVVVVPGDHSFAEKPDPEAAKGAENVDAAARALTLWCRRFVGV